jgi:hypothetical protein
MLLALAFTNRLHQPGTDERPATPEQLVDLFLHGVLIGPAERNGAEQS